MTNDELGVALRLARDDAAAPEDATVASMWNAVAARARELLAKPVATREAVREWVTEQRKPAFAFSAKHAASDFVFAALTHFAPPSPPAPEGLPSVEEIEKLMGADETIRSGSWPTPHCARVARALLEKHARGRMMIDGMTPDQLHLVFIKEWVSLHPSTSAPPIKFAFHCATAAYRLATTPPPVTPKLDEDAGADLERCETCKFYAVGYCRRFPPVSLSISDGMDTNSSYPTVSGLDWCGEWRTAKQVKP